MLEVDLGSIPGLGEYIKEPLDSDVYKAWRRREYQSGSLKKDPLTGVYQHEGTRYRADALRDSIPMIIVNKVL